jgi:hypothetical protein
MGEHLRVPGFLLLKHFLLSLPAQDQFYWWSRKHGVQIPCLGPRAKYSFKTLENQTNLAALNPEAHSAEKK